MSQIYTDDTCTQLRCFFTCGTQHYVMYALWEKL